MAVADLELAPIGNCSVSALVDGRGRYVWACVPRVDGDPVFCALLGGRDPGEADALGVWAIDIEDFAEASQEYERNTPIVRTTLTDSRGGAIEIVDFCPRYRRHNRIYRPTAFVRIVRPLRGSPRIRVRLSAATDWGSRQAGHTYGSNHIRHILSDTVLRLTTSAPVSLVRSQEAFRLEEELVFFLGPDEPFDGDLRAAVHLMHDNTRDYWMLWTRMLATPLEWQADVIRAAIALKLCVYEETGAIVAALTTSIPEAPNSGRTWDYRYCWIRDAYYTIQALNRLGAADILEAYLGYLRNIVDATPSGKIQPVYGVGMEPILEERTVASLPGYRGMGPVRVGNQAHEQVQHDVYGQIVLSTVQAFYDQRLYRPAGEEDFRALETVGERAYATYLVPDAGPWEFRSRAINHTYSAMMSWAACDRLAKTAARIGLAERQTHWRLRADEIRGAILAKAWSDKHNRFSVGLDDDGADASLLQLLEVRFLRPDDERFLSTLAALEKELRRGSHLLRYAREDDFGVPETAFNFCTFWYIEALWLVGRREEARELFQAILDRRTKAGLLSEDGDFVTGEPWGNYPQTYSLAGLINCAVLLSDPWSTVR